MNRPLMPSRLSRATNRAKPPVRALVQSFYYIDGVPFVDANLMRGGRLVKRVPVLQGGGTADTFMHMPVGINKDAAPDPSTAPHVVIMYDTDDAPCAVGLIPRRQNGAALEAGKVKPVEEDADEKHAANDFRMQMGTASLAMSKTNGWSMTPPTEAPVVRVQLPAGGTFRISEDGQAEDRIAVAGATEEYVAELTETVNKQTALIYALLEAMLASGDLAMSTAAATARRIAPGQPSLVASPTGRFASKSVRVSAETLVGKTTLEG